MSDKELGAFAKVDQVDAGDFIDRLDRMHRVEDVRAYKVRSFEALRLFPGARVADIGCGAGDDAAQLAALVGPEGLVTGVDASEAMIGEAAKRLAGTPALNFAVAPVEHLPFEDGSLDAIRADRLLIHVADPGEAIAEMLRVLKPGGRIALSEPDILGSWISSDDPELGDAVCRAVALSCAQPFLARNFGIRFADMNLAEAGHHALAMVTYDFATVDRVFQFELVSGMLGKSGKFEPERAAAWYHDQLARKAADRFCACMIMVTVWATKAQAGDAGFMLTRA
jgi:SAM-dependent methyltransferase